MALISLATLNVNLSTSNSPTVVLAASSVVRRWVRGLTVVNNGTAATWNFAVGTSAVQTAANSIWFGIPIASGATFIHNFSGKGQLLLTPATDVIMAFASQANVAMAVVYDELNLT